jgi:DNA-binding transcriptional regulator YdaS (Cro superfamily)
MNLRAYLDQLPRGAITVFAAKVGITPVYLSQLAACQDGRAPSPELCVVIELATSKTVTRRDLRPADWQAIWPELIAPAKPADSWTGTDRRITERRSKVRRTDDRRAS